MSRSGSGTSGLGSDDEDEEGSFAEHSLPEWCALSVLRPLSLRYVHATLALIPAAPSP